jgi:hypothetical protein
MRRLSVVQAHLAPEPLSVAAAVSTPDKGDFEQTREAEKKRCEWTVDEVSAVGQVNFPLSLSVSAGIHFGPQ